MFSAIKTIISSLEKLELIATQSNGKIFIRGAGKNGYWLAYELKQLGIPVHAFIDKPDKNCKINIPIISPEQFYLQYAEDNDILILNSVHNDTDWEDIQRETMEMNLGDILVDFGKLILLKRSNQSMPLMAIKPLFNNGYELMDYKLRAESKRYKIREELLSDLNNIRKKLFIWNLNFMVTNACNLKCKNCIQSVPYIKNKLFSDPHTAIADLCNLLSYADIGILQLIGGEITLHPKLSEIIKLLLELDVCYLDKIGMFSLITNAAVRPDEYILKMLQKLKQKKDLQIFISVYPSEHQYIEEYKMFAEKYDIRLVCSTLYDFTDYGLQNLERRNYTDEELRHIMKICPTAGCFDLFDGVLYHCDALTNLHYNNLIPDNQTDYIDVRNVTPESFHKDLEQFLYYTEYLEGCQYCDSACEFSRTVSRGLQLCSTRER